MHTVSTIVHLILLCSKKVINNSLRINVILQRIIQRKTPRDAVWRWEIFPTFLHLFSLQPHILAPNCSNILMFHTINVSIYNWSSCNINTWHRNYFLILCEFTAAISNNRKKQSSGQTWGEVTQRVCMFWGIACLSLCFSYIRAIINASNREHSQLTGKSQPLFQNFLANGESSFFTNLIWLMKYVWV